MTEIKEAVQSIKHHLAIPSKNIQESMKFYTSIGCKAGRFNDMSAIFDFFGMQLVCHLAIDSEIPKSPTMYPRHFGIIVSKSDWDYLFNFFAKIDLTFFQNPMKRNEGKPQEHMTFFLKDPSNNLIEFKYYEDERMI